MLRSFFSGVAGLRNHQQAMDVIGNNISNVNTPGFKGSRVTFVDTLSQTLQGAREPQADAGGSNPMQVGLGMTVSAISRDFSQGALQTTGRNLDVAIEGNGFFIVGEGNDYFYTRAGAFNVDDNFNLVTNSGDRVYGWTDTDLDGTVQTARDDVGWINLDRRGDGRITNALASATPVVNGANQGDASLGPVTTFDTTVSDTWTVACTSIDQDPASPTVGQALFTVTGDHNGHSGPATVAVGGTFSAPEVGSFTIIGQPAAAARAEADTNGNGQSLVVEAKEWGAGGNQYSIEFVTRANQQSLQLGTSDGGTHFIVYLPVDVNNQPTKTEAEVAEFLRNQPTFNSVADVTIEDSATGTVLLDATGTADPALDTATAARSFSSVNFENGSGPNLGDSFSFTTTAAGGAELENLTVTRDGGVVGIFSNGTTETIGQIALASVPNPSGLLSVGQGLFAESPSSGSGFPPRVAGSGGTGNVTSGFLEMSNVDLTREFTDMIVTQRGFQANSRIITTSDEMLQDLLALKR